MIELNDWVRTFSHLSTWSCQPIGFPDAENTAAAFLEQVIAFHMESPHLDLFKFLTWFWESGPTLSLHNRESILGAAIEGLAQTISDNKLNTRLRDQFEKQKTELQTAKQKAIKLLEQDSDLSSSPYSDQFERTINNCNVYNIKETIRYAALSVKVELTDSQLEAWKKLRHPSAHGSHLTRTMNNERLTNFNTCVDILNQLALGLIGYRGKYFSNVTNTASSMPSDQAIEQAIDNLLSPNQ